ncbi:MAG: hypothetical protein AAGJ31_04055 [Verrucomicrobiota bacterium]
MQRYHRKRHLTAWLLLTPILAIAFWIALQGRPTFPSTPPDSNPALSTSDSPSS